MVAAGLSRVRALVDTEAMSRENVEVVRRAVDGFNRRGLDALLELADPEIEWTTTGRYVEAGTYRGHEGVRQYLGAALAEFDDARTDADEYIDAGDHVVVASRFSGTGKRSGIPVELEMTIVYTIRDGKIVRARNFEDKAEALRAAGLTEQ
jgi:ketosteroid isomerase-like protein